jgi:phospholipase/lecithinase/hemolysin
MRVVKTACLAAAAVLTTATFSAPLAAQAPFGSIVVFGTSLSDPGNALALWGGTNTPPDYLLDPFLAACVTPGVPSFTCPSPDEFLYWDGIHPSKTVHGILAQVTASALFQ